MPFKTKIKHCVFLAVYKNTKWPIYIASHIMIHDSEQKPGCLKEDIAAFSSHHQNIENIDHLQVQQDGVGRSDRLLHHQLHHQVRGLPPPHHHPCVRCL